MTTLVQQAQALAARISVDEDGWLHGAGIVHAPGIPDKIYSERNALDGITFHSIVGSWEAAIGRFMSEQKDASGRYTPYAQSSCGFIQPYDEPLIQMYSIWDSTWTSGGRYQNTHTIAIELEGGPMSNPSEPIRDYQVVWVLALVIVAVRVRGWRPSRALPNRTIFEHRDWAATSCPSNRYDRVYPLLEGLQAQPVEDDMTPEEVQAIVAAATAPLVTQIDDLWLVIGSAGIDVPKLDWMKRKDEAEIFAGAAPTGGEDFLGRPLFTLKGASAIRYMKLAGFSLAQSLRNTQREVHGLDARTKGLPGRVSALEQRPGPIPDVAPAVRVEVAASFEHAAQALRGGGEE